MSATIDTRTVMFLVDDIGHAGEPIRFNYLNEANTFAGVMARRGATAIISVVSVDRHGDAFGPVLRLSTHGPITTGAVN